MDATAAMRLDWFRSSGRVAEPDEGRDPIGRSATDDALPGRPALHMEPAEALTFVHATAVVTGAGNWPGVGPLDAAPRIKKPSGTSGAAAVTLGMRGF